MENTDYEDRWVDRLLSKSSLSQTKRVWEIEAGLEEFQAELGLVFRNIAEGFDQEDTRTTHLLLKENDTPRAILELSGSKRENYTELVSLHLSPTYWDNPTPTMLAEVYRAAIMSLSEIVTQGASNNLAGVYEVKIYGRDREMLDILRELSNDVKLTPPLDISMVGRWLSIKIGY